MQRVPSCSYCFKPYAFKGSGRPVGPRIPRLLSCGHTFCDGCVSKLSEIHHLELVCPTCESRTALPGGKKQIKDLPTNLYVLGILINNVRAALEKDVTKGELSNFGLDRGFNFIPRESTTTTTEAGDSAEQTKCEECCTNIATSECRKCEALFCKACFTTVHSSSRTLRSHEAIPLSLSRLPGFGANDCTSHDGKELEFYDKTDEKAICSLCAVSPDCQGHNLVPIAEMYGDVEKKIRENLEDVQKIHATLQQSRGKLSRMFPEIKSECGEVVQQIREHFQDLHTRLQAREVELIREVKVAYCNESFLVNTAKEILQQEKVLEMVIEQSTMVVSSPSLIMKGGEVLLSKLANFKDTPCMLSQSSVQDLVKVSYPSDFQDVLNDYGAVVSESSGLQLKMFTEEPEDISDTMSQDDRSTITSTDRDESVGEEATSSQSGSTLMSLPLRQNLVYVTHIKNPCDFMVQHAADGERLENLMDAINQYCEGAKGLNDVVKSTQVGDMVCAQYSKDRYWYRARIIGQQQRLSAPKSQVQPLPKVEVCFIDYGNTEVVPLNRLRKIRPEFTDIPELAMNCSLVDIAPPTQNETWPAQSIKAFGSLTRDKALLMSVVKKSGGKMYIDLKSSDEEPTKDDDKPASVRDALVFLDVAWFNSAASTANPKDSFPVRSYKKAIVPEEGETLDIIVTYAENPDAVYVMRDTGKEYADTMRMINQMSSVYSTKKGNQWRIMWPYKGLVCAARFSGDNVWYRALVTAVVADRLVRVSYIDFGNSEELPFSEIRRIPDHMAQLPVQAMQCRLAGTKPIDDEKGWSDDCSIFLSDTCTMNKYRMKVIEAEEDKPMCVVLYEMDASQTTSVNRLLLVNMHAGLTNPGYLECLQSEEPTNSEVSSPGNEVSSHDDSSEVQSGSFSFDEMERDTPGETAQQKQILFPKKLMYKPVALPNKAKFEFAVTYVDEDCTISGYQTENGDHSLPDLMKHVQKICISDSTSSLSQDQLSFNQPCCAEFSEDGLWYRAEVIDFPLESTVLVDYIDFGNREVIPLTSVKLNAAFLEIPKQSLPVQLEGLPCTPFEQAKVSKHLSSLLVGQVCMATTMKSLVQGVVKCVQITLPDGSDVLETAKNKMLEEHARKNPKQQKSLEAQDESIIAAKTGPIRSLISDTFLPEEGIAFDVTVTQVDKPNVVFLQRIPPTEDDPGYAEDKDPTLHIAHDHLVQLLDISEKINTPDYFEDKSDIKNVWPNMLCCACYTQDELWYRAQIMDVKSTDPLEVRVLYIDYGTSEVIELNRVKPFPSELVSLPKQAFRCSVVGLHCPKDQDSDSESTIKSIDSLIKAIAGKKLICKVLDFNPPIEVELHERVFNEESYEDVPLHQRLSEIELIMEMNVLDLKEDESAESVEESTVKDDQVPDSVKDDYMSNKEAEDGGEEPEVDDHYHDEKVAKESKECKEVQKSSLNIRAAHLELITPAQFCLKKNSPQKNTSEGETSSKKVDYDEVD